MKRKIIFIFIICVSLFSISFAHSGKTDSNGGHYDRSTGEYHYHNGKELRNIELEDNKKNEEYKKIQQSKQENIIQNNTKKIDNKNENEHSTNDGNFIMIILIIIISIFILWITNPFKNK